MKNILYIFIILACFNNCKSSKRVKNTPSKVITKKNKETNGSYNTEADDIIKHANKFIGVRYKWGGVTKAGMDCSGLVYESFRAHNIYLPRISRDMAKKGKKVSLKLVEKGDLLFFKTQNKRNSINHVGLVTNTKRGIITFIHATTRRGVITSTLKETYWQNAFVEARRIL